MRSPASSPPSSPGASLRGAPDGDETWRLEEAARSFSRATSADPTSLEAWRGLATSLTQLGRGTDARASLARALAAPDLLPGTELALLVASVELAGELGDHRGADDAASRLRRLARASRGPLQSVAFDHLRRLAADAARRSFARPARVRILTSREVSPQRHDGSHLAHPTGGAGTGKLLAAAIVLVTAGCIALATLGDGAPTPAPAPQPQTAPASAEWGQTLHKSSALHNPPVCRVP